MGRHDGIQEGHDGTRQDIRGIHVLYTEGQDGTRQLDATCQDGFHARACRGVHLYANECEVAHAVDTWWQTSQQSIPAGLPYCEK